ncbi:GH92 family glycosyl hydrolase [Dysgonomonas sp. HGC4]|uniref:GH92 family glycosyl hydrolase n=1 Tax=Dysgonomonas sp. HGC4 TaxID=1658009 RepID=UPI00067FFB56|nr:GH92 family glycosyl hydrolase [Dysgonomonas sp. HGC4]MBD8347873.1 GH92 family glycosyl hydrolase [Dysgonomonas sp. HGC4]
MKKHNALFSLTLCTILFLSCQRSAENSSKNPVDYVDPYIGNISHLLVPTYPTVHLPFSMLRVYPERKDFTSDQIEGLPVIVTSHRGSSAFNISPYSGKRSSYFSVQKYSYGEEVVTPYRYQVYLDDDGIEVDYAPSYRSAVYKINFPEGENNVLVINTRNGFLQKEEKGVSGYQVIDGGPTKVYLYLETLQTPQSIGCLENGNILSERDSISGKNQAIGLNYNDKQIDIRYGISFISIDQAKKNLQNEINTFNVDEVAKKGQDLWNKTLSKIQVEGDDESAKTVFYTSLYRTYERMINLSEDGSYYSGIDNQVHEDKGIPFYTDDWIWDTYRATHPLRILIEPDIENNMIASYIRMAQQTKEGWMPTFPEVTGDSHRMNSNHAVAVIWDAYCKGLRGFDLEAAYNACKGAITEKSLLPWKRIPNTELDIFYKEKGYYPALREGQEEYIPEVNRGEKRQPVAVTLGTCYDYWCLSEIAKELGKKNESDYFLAGSYNYRNLYNKETAFFHPKDKEGKFIDPFDYRFAGGMGARDYYGENNGWVYRWDVPHNPADLIRLMGSAENFINNLDQTFREPLGKSKFEFYAQLPDHTGNVGQFSMANEPSMHIPYLYNYVGQPWKTQKRIRTLLKQWFRNDLMGMPGDEDGGGMTAFVVFSSMGFYPVTPGSATYNIGSPVFRNVKMTLGNGKLFEIEAKNYAKDNIYIQSATLNGKSWDKPWFSHSNIANGAKLVLVMGNKPNKAWGADLLNTPPSAIKID